MLEITPDEYHRIQNGMSYDQVIEIIGVQGEKENVPFRDHLVKYRWANNCGGALIAMFHENELIGKTAYGLNIGKKVYVIDGALFSSLDEFAEQFSNVVLKEHQWHGNLDAFNDILRGGFGTPEDGFILRWENSSFSRERLGYPRTSKWLRELLARCHPENAIDIKRNEAEAKQRRGQTLFDTIVEIIRDHGIEGEEEEDGVELQLL